MKPIQINLKTMPCISRRIACLLMTGSAVLLLAFSAANFRLHRNLKEEIALCRDRIQRLESVPPAAETSKTEVGEEEIRNTRKLTDFVNRLIAKDQFPWDRILDAFEENMPENVYLESLFPDREFRRVILKGYADSMSEVSMYLKEKEDNPLFQKIILQKISVGQDSESDTGRKSPPVQFELESTLRFDTVFPKKEYGTLGETWEKTSEKS